jgi:Domain of unknown function (DUF4328)
MSVVNMMPREHHYTFTHRLLPSEFFKAPDRVVQELSGPMGGTFLFYLWEEIGKVASAPIKAADTGTLPGTNQQMQVLKLDVAGVTQDGNRTLIVISLPPTEFPGEAMFVAVVNDNGRPRYFAFERNAGVPSLGEDPDSAYLAEYGSDQTRTSHGAKPGTDAAAFSRGLSEVLGAGAGASGAAFGAAPPSGGSAFGAVPTPGGSGGAFGAVPTSGGSGGAFGAVPTSGGSGGAFGAVPTSGGSGGAFAGASAALGSGGGGSGGAFGAAGQAFGGGSPGFGGAAREGRLAGIGKVLSGLVIALLAWPLVMRVLGGLFYSILGDGLVNGLHSLVSLAMGVTLLIWVYQLFAGLGGKGGWSPVMSVAGWLIPVANFVLPPMILRSGWRAVSNGQGGLVPLLWWPIYLASILAAVFWQFFPDIADEAIAAGLDPDILSTVSSLLSWMTTLVDMSAYGLLLYIVRTITKRA